MSLTPTRLREVLTYNPETGDFIWNVSVGRVKRGTVARCLDGDGYIRIQIDGVRYFAHRLAWFYIFNEFPDPETDHKNRIKTDNRISNLRITDRSGNNQNRGPFKWRARQERAQYV